MRDFAAATVAFASTLTADAVASDFEGGFNKKPKTIAAFSVIGKDIEMLAVTRRTRADTAIRKRHLEESRAMAKVMPGYPQPAFISLDFTVRF